MALMTTSPPPRPTTEAPEQTETRAERLWHLVLLDDNDHSYEYVIEMLASIFGYGPEKAFALARIVDSEGRVILETASRPQCERHQSQIHAYGADPRIPASKGSMSAVLEEA